jgi:hypothetical protein
MSDDFERFLASALAPPERMPDRRFVSAVQAAIVLEERLAAERRALAAGLLKQLAALLSISAAVWLVGRAPLVSSLFAETPGFVLVAVLIAFACAIGLIGSRPAGELSASQI